MDDVAVITEDASELLCDVCPAVSTSRTGCRRFHGLPVVLCGRHGCGGVYSDAYRWSRRQWDSRSAPIRQRDRQTIVIPVRAYRIEGSKRE